VKVEYTVKAEYMERAEYTDQAEYMERAEYTGRIVGEVGIDLQKARAHGDVKGFIIP
jgi:hypothetical protein